MYARRLRAALLAAALVAAPLARAEIAEQALPGNVTLGELKLMPPICLDTQGFVATGWIQHQRQSPRSQYWVDRIGPVFWAMHHYCWALINEQRLKVGRIDPRFRAHISHVMVADFTYVIKHAQEHAADPRSSVMLPELFYRRGQALVQQGRIAEAMADYEAARVLKPDYWPAYLGHAQLLVAARMTDKAREMLEQGLRQSPDEPNLKAALAQLQARGRATARTGAAPARAVAAGASAPATR